MVLSAEVIKATNSSCSLVIINFINSLQLYHPVWKYIDSGQAFQDILAAYEFYMEVMQQVHRIYGISCFLVRSDQYILCLVCQLLDKLFHQATPFLCYLSIAEQSSWILEQQNVTSYINELSSTSNYINTYHEVMMREPDVVVFESSERDESVTDCQNQAELLMNISIGNLLSCHDIFQDSAECDCDDHIIHNPSDVLVPLESSCDLSTDFHSFSSDSSSIPTIISTGVVPFCGLDYVTSNFRSASRDFVIISPSREFINSFYNCSDCVLLWPVLDVP